MAWVFSIAAAASCSAESIAGETAHPKVLLVELDVLESVETPAPIWSRSLELTAASFRDVGIELDFVISRAVEDPGGTLTNRTVKSALMASTRHQADAIHVVVASRGGGAHGVSHYEVGPNAEPTSAGVLVFADTIASDFARNELLEKQGLTTSQLLSRTITHELGHALGCPHFEPDSQRSEEASVMVQNSGLGPVNDDGIDRWRNALNGDGAGYPRFDASDKACLDITSRLSVELAKPSYRKRR